MNADDDLLATVIGRALRPELRTMHAYAVQPADGLVKLDTMESPYRLPPALQQALGERLGRVALNRYPAGDVETLKASLAVHAGLPDGCTMTLGNGSDELIAMLTLACAVPGQTVLAPVPTFVMYELSARLHGLRFVGVPLDDDFQLDLDAMRAAIDRDRPVLLWLAQPNNPTASLWDEAAIESLVAAMAAHGGLVVMDEAYQPFASRDARALLGRHPNVLVMRTLSKFGLAGVRIGWLMGRAALVAQIDKVRPPFNVGVLNAQAACFALEHEDVYRAQAAETRAERGRLVAALGRRDGVRVWPSDANMVLARVPRATDVWRGMKVRGVLVKDVSAMHPRLASCLRLTVGTPDENVAMLAAFDAARTDLDTTVEVAR